MAPSSRDRLSVDLRGLKAALLLRAQTLGVSPSDLVRRVLAEAIGEPATLDTGTGAPSRSTRSQADRARLCLRMPREQAHLALELARRAGVTPGEFVGGLLLDVPVYWAGGGRDAHLAALTASCAELATLSRNIHRLSALLRQADAESARTYRGLLDTVAGQVRTHLERVAPVLSALQPRARPSARTRPTQANL